GEMCGLGVSLSFVLKDYYSLENVPKASLNSMGPTKVTWYDGRQGGNRGIWIAFCTVRTKNGLPAKNYSQTGR
ncbi:MAG: hypothetical protein KAS94_13960, partial [Desulfobulbaceae bacterium]|nr:hypothetical protein [Desulfobulbaceae bacterium]